MMEAVFAAEAFLQTVDVDDMTRDQLEIHAIRKILDSPLVRRSDSFSASSLSLVIISDANCSRSILGAQPSLSKALLESPNNSSTSVGRKYLESTLITIS